MKVKGFLSFVWKRKHCSNQCFQHHSMSPICSTSKDVLKKIIIWHYVGRYSLDMLEAPDILYLKAEY